MYPRPKKFHNPKDPPPITKKIAKTSWTLSLDFKRVCIYEKEYLNYFFQNLQKHLSGSLRSFPSYDCRHDVDGINWIFSFLKFSSKNWNFISGRRPIGHDMDYRLEFHSAVKVMPCLCNEKRSLGDINNDCSLFFNVLKFPLN